MKLFLFSLIVVSIAVSIYCLLAILLKLPSFKVSMNISSSGREKKKKVINLQIIESYIKSYAQLIPMSMMKESSLQKKLTSANMPDTPKQYVSVVYAYTAFFLLLTIITFFINPLFAVIPFALTGLVYYMKINEVDRKSSARKKEIEHNLPQFTSYVANSLSSNRNILEIINIYNQNYDSELTKELLIVVADMRTGNYQTALQRFNARINSPLISELVRGLIASINGDDMTIYFESLSMKMDKLWEQRIREIALKKEPKLSMLSYISFGLSLLSVAYVMYNLVIANIGIIL
ncbi:MAG: secretion protein [Oscillospiraceae bacterium]|nr:secretion protein [Oscillospiraceae bacterium]